MGRLRAASREVRRSTEFMTWASMLAADGMVNAQGMVNGVAVNEGAVRGAGVVLK